MRNADKEITLYHYLPDPETGYDKSVRYFIQGVSVFGTTAVSVGKEGFSSADVYTIRVPEERGEFPFQEGDVIVVGRAEEESPRRGELKKKYPDSLMVVSCTDNRGKFGSHWKVVCK